MKKKILIIRFSSLGDIILSSALTTNLKINFPQAEIVYLTKEKFHDVVKQFDSVDKIVSIPDSPSILFYYRLLLQLDNDNFDILIDLHRNYRSWLARKIITASRTVIYPKRRLERISLVKNKQTDAGPSHTIDAYNDCLNQLELKIHCKRPILKASENISIPVREFIKRNDTIIICAPSAAHETKRYPVEKFSYTVEILSKQLNAGIIWAVMGVDKVMLKYHGNTDESKFLELVDCPIDELSGVISKADVTISNDSGLMHLSSAVGTPTVAVFGPTHPALGFAPRGMYDKIAEVDEYCRPCSLHGKKKCFREEQFCFTNLNPDMIIEEASAIIESNFRKNRAVFVDRDGTIIKDKHFLSDVDEIELEENAVKGLKILKDAGFKIVVISNQSGVARGFFDVNNVEQVNSKFMEMLSTEGVNIDAIFYCPHYEHGSVNEFSYECDCRKPSPAMAEEAAIQLNLDLRRSYVIGDKMDDFNLGKVIGGQSLLVLTGHGNNEKDNLAENNKKIIFKNLFEAAKYIVDEEKNT